MIEIDLYRIRIGKFLQKTQARIRKVRNETSRHGDFKSLFIKIVLLISVLVASSEGGEAKTEYSDRRLNSDARRNSDIRRQNSDIRRNLDIRSPNLVISWNSDIRSVNSVTSWNLDIRSQNLDTRLDSDIRSQSSDTRNQELSCKFLKE